MCDSNAVDHLVLLEDSVDPDWLLEQAVAEFDLGCGVAAVDLDLHQVGLFLLEGCFTDLCVGKNADNGAVLLDALKLAGDGGALVLGVLLSILGESLLLRFVPILVESSLQLVRQMLGPDGGERAQTTRGLDVADQTDDHHLYMSASSSNRIGEDCLLVVSR